MLICKYVVWKALDTCIYMSMLEFWEEMMISSLKAKISLKILNQELMVSLISVSSLDHLPTGLLDQELIMFIINRFGGTRADNIYNPSTHFVDQELTISSIYQGLLNQGTILSILNHKVWWTKSAQYPSSINRFAGPRSDNIYIYPQILWT